MDAFERDATFIVWIDKYLSLSTKQPEAESISPRLFLGSDSFHSSLFMQNISISKQNQLQGHDDESTLYLVLLPLIYTPILLAVFRMEI